MVNRTKSSLHTVVAPHYLTRLAYAFSGNGYATTVAGPVSYFSVYANGLRRPGNTANLFTTAGTCGGTLVPATLSLANLNPMGVSQLGVLYSSYRVFASRIKVTMTPTGNPNADSGAFVVYPSDLDMPVTDFQRAIALPYSKTIQISEYNNIKQNTISIYMDNPTILGYTKQQYKDDPNTMSAVNTNPVNATYWNVIAYDLVGGNWAATNIIVNVQVEYQCEFLEPFPPTDV